MQIEFTLTIEADSPKDVMKIIEELEQKEILTDSYAEYDEDWVEIIRCSLAARRGGVCADR